MIELPNIPEQIKNLFVPKRFPCHTNRASSLGYFVPELKGCIRRGVYERTQWEKKELWDADSLMRFEEGNRQEAHIMADLIKAGLNPIEQQTALEWKEKEITGHLDAVLVVDGKPVVLEIKSASPYIFDQIHSFEDLNKKPWLRSYKIQINLYMLLKEMEQGILLFKDKSSGDFKQINVTLDYELTEYAIRAAEAINKHVKENTLAERITDREVCKKCPFKHLCLPDIDFGAELKIEDDPELEARIDEALSLKEPAANYKKVWDICKSRFKASANGDNLNVIIGKYRVTGKKSARGAYTFKPEVI
jgi:CRISPR/Cas system-associated exonuclease Cas4 (RecB family)